MSKFGKIRPKHGVLCVFMLLLVHASGIGQTPQQGVPRADPMPAIESLQAFTAAGIPTAGPAALAGAAGEMIGFSNVDASGTMTITLVHTGKSWMAVYHIDRNGEIRLISSRKIKADFSLSLNLTQPFPVEIEKMGNAE